MTRIPDGKLDAADGIITLDGAATRFALDPAVIIAGLLQKEWNDQNTDGVTPTIGIPEVMKAIKWQGGRDYITVWNEGSSGETPNAVEYGFTSETLQVKIEFVTAYALAQQTAAFKGHMHRLREEARRIVLANRLDSDPASFLAQPAGPIGSALNPKTYSQLLTGRQWIKWAAHKTEPQPWSGGTFRFVVICEIDWRFREVKTS